MRQRKARLFFLTALLVLLAVLAYGFAAQNTVPTSYAGDGQAQVEGFTVSNVHYVLDSSDPSLISQVTFSLDPTPGDVHVLVGLDTDHDANHDVDSWQELDCQVNGTSVTCTYPSNTDNAVLDVVELRVIAAQ